MPQFQASLVTEPQVSPQKSLKVYHHREIIIGKVSDSWLSEISDREQCDDDSAGYYV